MWDVPPCEPKQRARRPPWWLHGPFRALHHILTKIELNQEAMMAQQDQLNEIVTRLSTATEGIRQDVADLKAQAEAGQPLDFTALEEKVSALEGLDAENPAPAPEPEPEPTPEG